MDDLNSRIARLQTQRDARRAIDGAYKEFIELVKSETARELARDLRTAHFKIYLAEATETEYEKIVIFDPNRPALLEVKRNAESNRYEAQKAYEPHWSLSSGFVEPHKYCGFDNSRSKLLVEAERKKLVQRALNELMDQVASYMLWLPVRAAENAATIAKVEKYRAEEPNWLLIFVVVFLGVVLAVFAIRFHLFGK